ncbi:MAG: carboxypeptidase regulatory-like domain-containing protein [Blastocatellia bacterium]
MPLGQHFIRLSAGLTIVLALAVTTLAQGTNAALSGTVTDANQAAVPGATVTAVNVNTGVSNTTTTNESGVYSYPSLQPGAYRLSVEKPGFKKGVLNDIGLELSARLTLNVSLEVGGVENSVEVSAAQDTALAIGSTSVGGVVNGMKVRDLPLPGRNALDLVLTQAGLNGSNFSGARIGSLNVQRDGINVQDQRINQGINSSVFNSTDVVDEVRVVTAPADAEFGRGSGQVLLTTKSGTNSFHGTLFESHRNTVLTANTWFNNLNGNPRNTLIRNQFGGTVGGPIIKNKTFFFFAYDGQRQSTKNTATRTVYTAQARQGLFRYYPGVRNGNANAAVPTVDLSGNAIKPATATGDLQSLSVFGLDPNRRVADSTGIVKRFLDLTPLPNNFRVGDGLNTAGYVWSLPGTSDRDQYNFRFDHKLSEKHNINFNYVKEDEFFLNGFLAQPFPASPGGTQENVDRLYSLAVISTLSPRLVNEFRAGANRGSFRFYAPWELEAGKSVFPTANNQIYTPVFANITTPIDQSNDPQGRISPFYTFTDTLTWQRGRHGFKGGVEFRFASTNGFNSFTVLPRASIGSGGAAITGLPTTGATALGQNLGLAQGLLNDLAGSLASIQQAFNAPGGANPVFLAGEGKQRTWQTREFSWFFKDDFKVSPNLTLNMGVRYEFYGVPFEANGKTAGLIGGSGRLFGWSGSSFNDIFQPGARKGEDTLLQLVGKNSPNADVDLYNPDYNNFAPAVGFSWAIPYFGKNKTILRAGYGVGYERNSLRMLDVVAGDQPGLRTVTNFAQTAYLDLAKVTLPLTPIGKPLDAIPLTDRTQTMRAYDTNLRTAYTQNWNIGVQRELFKDYLFEVRYVANKGSKLIRGVNINEANIFASASGQTLLEAFNAVRTGGDSVLLDRIFNGVNLGGGAVNGTTVRAGTGLRNNTNTQGFFANGNVGGFATFLNNTANFGTRGVLFRNAGLPENWILANPQFAGASLTGNFASSTYHSLQVELTKRFSNGLAVQSNYTFSKSLGEEEGSGQEQRDDYRTLRNLRLDKRLLSFSTPHIWRTNVIYSLPLGPGKKFLKGKNPVISRLVEQWQISTIYNVFSGSPIGLGSGVSTFNQNTDNTPVLVGDFAPNFGKAQKVANGVVYFDGLKQVTDPSIAGVTTSQGLQGRSTLLAVTDASGKVLLINPVPGQIGTMSQLYLYGPGSFRLDINLIKRVRIHEDINFEFRVDAIDVLNTPQWGNPNTDINSVNFGRITGAGGNRIVVLTGKINF